MLINDRYVLTGKIVSSITRPVQWKRRLILFRLNQAAHCVKGFMWFMIKVTFGEHNRCDDSMRPETRFVLRAISQKFSYSNFDNDMALLRLNDHVPITQFIRPICLPSIQGNYTTFPSHDRIAGESGAKWESKTCWKACDWCHRIHKWNWALDWKQKLITSRLNADHFPCYSMSRTSPDDDNVRHSLFLQMRCTSAKPVWWRAGVSDFFIIILLLYIIINLGTLKEDGKPSCILQEVEVPILSNDDCTSKTNYTSKMITNNMLCAGYPGVGLRDSCQGDSGES